MTVSIAYLYNTTFRVTTLTIGYIPLSMTATSENIFLHGYSTSHKWKMNVLYTFLKFYQRAKNAILILNCSPRKSTVQNTRIQGEHYTISNPLTNSS